MSGFSSLNVALTGLTAQQRGLDVTGQNIANANTDGYTRQRVLLESIGSATIPAAWSTGDQTGAGVTVSDIQRMNDAFLDGQARNAHGQQTLLAGRAQTLTQIEQSFPEPGPNGLASTLATFWSDWQAVGNDPGSLAARSQLLEQAGAVTSSLQQASSNLQSQWSSARGQLDTLVSQVNETAASVASLNQAIASAVRTGHPANELSDQRDQLTMKLADLVGATVSQGQDGTVDVLVGGTALVRGSTAQQLAVSGTATQLGTAGPGDPRLTWASVGTAAAVTGGQAAAMLDSLTATLPAWAGRLDQVAATLAASVNAVHASGFDLSGTPGASFFTGTTASTIAVALTDPHQVAASAVPGGNLDNGTADAMAQLATSPTGPDAVYQQMVVDLGVQTQAATSRSTMQDTVAQQADSARQGQAGVSTDEEMVHLISYQHAYEAAARLMTTIDSTLDTLINHTGLIGG